MRRAFGSAAGASRWNDRSPEHVSAGRQVVFGIRPEHLRLATSKDDPENVDHRVDPAAGTPRILDVPPLRGRRAAPDRSSIHATPSSRTQSRGRSNGRTRSWPRSTTTLRSPRAPLWTSSSTCVERTCSTRRPSWRSAEASDRGAHRDHGVAEGTETLDRDEDVVAGSEGEGQVRDHPVPVSRTAPTGRVRARPRCEARCSNVRAIDAVVVESSWTVRPFRSIVSRISNRRLDRGSRDDRRPERARPVVGLGLWEVERVLALDRPGRDVVPDRVSDDRERGVEDERQLGLGDVPARVGPDADLGVRADRAPAGCFQERAPAFRPRRRGRRGTALRPPRPERHGTGGTSRPPPRFSWDSTGATTRAPADTDPRSAEAIAASSVGPVPARTPSRVTSVARRCVGPCWGSPTARRNEPSSSRILNSPFGTRRPYPVDTGARGPAACRASDRSAEG